MIVRENDIVEFDGKTGTVFRVEEVIDDDGEQGFDTVHIRWRNGDCEKIDSSEFYPIGEKEIRTTDENGDTVISYENVYSYKVITPKVYVNTYLHDRAYGGPEEGGWYYDYWEPVSSQRFATEAEAKASLDSEERNVASENTERRSDIGSVLSEGCYEVCLEAWPAEYKPKNLPRYS